MNRKPHFVICSVDIQTIVGFIFVLIAIVAAALVVHATVVVVFIVLAVIASTNSFNFCVYNVATNFLIVFVVVGVGNVTFTVAGVYHCCC